MPRKLLDIYEEKRSISDELKVNTIYDVDVSFIISSRYGGSNRIYEAIDKLKRIKSFSYEILVFGNVYDVGGIKIVNETDFGSCYAYNRLASLSRGKYISGLTDYTTPPDNIDSLYDHLVKNNINIATMSACNHYKPCILNDCEDVMKMINSSCSFFKHLLKSSIQILFFPVVKKEYIYHMLNGYYFNPFFHHRYVDNWMGIFNKKIELSFKEFTPAYEMAEFKLCTGACDAKNKGHRRNNEYDTYDRAVLNSLIYNDPNNYSGAPDFNLLEKFYNE